MSISKPVVVPRLLITAGLAPAARSAHTRTHNKHSSAHMVISEYIRSGINLCFLHASLKTAAHLSTLHRRRKNSIFWKRVKKKKEGCLKKREEKHRPSHFFSFCSLFSLFIPSFPVHLLLSLCSFHPFDRWATFVEMERIWKCV